MRSRTRIRFSKSCLVTRATHDASLEDGLNGSKPLDINFRLMRASETAVRDARIYVQARFRPAETNGTARSAGELNNMDVVAELEITPSQLSVLDHWHVFHRIAPNSPLWPIRNLLRTHLTSVDVSLSAYDTAFQQEVKLFVHYNKQEIVHSAHFEPMQSTSEDGTLTTIDCSKLDQIGFPAIASRRCLSRAPSSTNVHNDCSRRGRGSE